MVYPLIFSSITLSKNNFNCAVNQKKTQIYSPEEAEAGKMRVMVLWHIVREIQGGLRVWVRKLRPRKVLLGFKSHH
jgi:hypothetical protein